MSTGREDIDESQTFDTWMIDQDAIRRHLLEAMARWGVTPDEDATVNLVFVYEFCKHVESHIERLLSPSDTKRTDAIFLINDIRNTIEHFERTFFKTAPKRLLALERALDIENTGV